MSAGRVFINHEKYVLLNIRNVSFDVQHGATLIKIIQLIVTKITTV